MITIHGLRNFPTYSAAADKAGMYDRFERIHRKLNSMILENRGHYTYECLEYYCKAMRDNEMDNHIILAGQNGSGKSISGLLLARRLHQNFDVRENVIYAFDTIDTLIEKISEAHDSLFMIDEANMFFYHKEHMDKKQIALLKAIEICRANQNIIISCGRDARRFSYQYRNGKVHTVINLFDRRDDNRPIGCTFLGNWFFEQEDKFMLNRLSDIMDYDELYRKIEDLPTFKGYFLAPRIEKEDEAMVTEYREFKNQQMLYSIRKWKREAKKKVKDEEQFTLGGDDKESMTQEGH